MSKHPEHSLRAAPQEIAGSPANKLLPRSLEYSLLIALGAVGLFLGVRPVGEQSAWLHLSIGRQLIGGGGFGRVDPWVPWAAQPYIPTERLSDVAAYKLHELFGLSSITWLRSADILLLLAVTIWCARRLADTVPALIAAGAALLGAGHALTARPQLLGFVFLSLAVVAWWQMAGDLGPRWWPVPLRWVDQQPQAVGRRCWPRRCHSRWACARPKADLGQRPTAHRGAGSEPRGRGAESHRTSIAADPAYGEARREGLRGLVAGQLCPRPGNVRDATHARPGGTELGTVAPFAPMVADRPLGAGLRGHAGHGTHDRRRSGCRGPAAGPDDAKSPCRDETPWRACHWGVGISDRSPLAATFAPRPTEVPTGLQSAQSNLPAGTVVLEDTTMSAWVGWVAPQLRPVRDSRSESFSRQQHPDYARLEAAAPGWDRILDRSEATRALVLTDSPLAAAPHEREAWATVSTDDVYSLMRHPG